MKKLLTFALALVVLAAFPGLSAAQKQPGPGIPVPLPGHTLTVQVISANPSAVVKNTPPWLPLGGKINCTSTGSPDCTELNIPPGTTIRLSSAPLFPLGSWSITGGPVTVTPGTCGYTVPNQGHQDCEFTMPPHDVKVTVELPKEETGKCDLVIGKSPSKGSIPLISGQQATFEIVVTNQGTGTCSAPIQVTDPLPPGLTFVAGGPPPWSGCPSCIYNQPLAPGQSVLLLITVNVTAPPGTSIKNCAGVKNPNDTNLANNEVCITLPVVPGKACDLAIKKSISPTHLVSGQPATITITVTNVGNAPCKGVTTMTDGPLPWLQVGSVAQGGSLWNCSVTPPNPGATVTCTWDASIQPVPPGPLPTITITGNVTAKPGSKVTNCATVTNQNDTNPANNKSCVTVPVK